MSQSPFLAAALLVALAFAACLEPKDLADSGIPGIPSVPIALESYVNPVILEHEHDDLDAHSIGSNVDLIGRDPMGEKGPSGGPGEIEVVGDYAYVAMLGYGFAIVDVSDPTAPKTVS